MSDGTGGGGDTPGGDGAFDGADPAREGQEHDEDGGITRRQLMGGGLGVAGLGVAAYLLLDGPTGSPAEPSGPRRVPFDVWEDLRAGIRETRKLSTGSSATTSASSRRTPPATPGS
jgi:hypothetical protein